MYPPESNGDNIDLSNNKYFEIERIIKWEEIIEAPGMTSEDLFELYLPMSQLDILQWEGIVINGDKTLL